MVVMEIDLGNGKMVMKAKNKMDKRKKSGVNLLWYHEN